MRCGVVTYVRRTVVPRYRYTVRDVSIWLLNDDIRVLVFRAGVTERQPGDKLRECVSGPQGDATAGSCPEHALFSCFAFLKQRQCCFPLEPCTLHGGQTDT